MTIKEEYAMTLASDNKAKYTSFTSIMASTPMKNHKAMVFDSNDGDEASDGSNKDEELGKLESNELIDAEGRNLEHEIINKEHDETKEEDINPYLKQTKEIETLLSSVTFQQDINKDDDDDDNLSNEISQLTEAEVELRREMEEVVDVKYGNYDTSKNVPLVCSNKSLVDDLEEEEEEEEEEEVDEYEGYLTLEEKVGWDDDFEQG